MPIRGIDTKWFGRHRALVEGLHGALTGLASLGLVGAPDLVRMRFLDDALRPGGLVDVTASVDELAALAVRPATMYVFENLETVLAMPTMAGVVVVHGSGYAARRLAAIPWIRDGRILYWGDLDADGFAILNTLRSHCDDVTSVLMDERTLLSHRDLWVPDPHAVARTYSHLTAAERATLQRLHAEGDVRLEQERIEWKGALTALVAAAARSAM